jgi:hypothetical protein
MRGILQTHFPFLKFKLTKKKESRSSPNDFLRAEGGTRTRTPVKAHAPETCVSTNFTTSAIIKPHLAMRLVPRTGLEPAHLAALPPQSSVSTNFTTWAY